MSSSATGSVTDPPIQFQVVHAVRGRTRMRVTPPHLADQLARAVERMLRDQPGVQEIRGNADSGSVVITYDPAVLRVDRLFAIGPPPADDGGWWLLSNPVAGVRDVMERSAGLVSAGRGRLEALWTAARDQMSAVMSFWSASSVVALSTRLLQWPSSARRAEADEASNR